MDINCNAKIKLSLAFTCVGFYLQLGSVKTKKALYFDVKISKECYFSLSLCAVKRNKVQS